MTNEIDAKVKEFVKLAESCPENLQEKCFELLLSKYLDQVFGKPSAQFEDVDQDDAARNKEKTQEDLSETDLHVKARKFLEKNSLTIGDINQIFYKEGDEILPLYEDLKSTKASECQIRIGLLMALKNGIKTGNFEFDGEAVRQECRTRKCYDESNFATNFRSSKDLFESFDKYKKMSPTVRLSAEGKTSLGELVKELR